jgi:hypothetical protein
MIRYLELKLYEKTKDTQSDILYAQWNYDKRLIPNALQAISNLFPHYSLHDESHSIAIINNIVRIVGKENIEKLSAIDLWLILEASYYHDIGMVVSSDKLSQAINSSDFIQFFKGLQQDKKNSLFDSANLFEIESNKIKYKNDYFNLEIFEGIKYILAEYFRRFHAGRSKEIINNPTEELSLFSPRGIIAPRIFNLLGEICACHTKDFTEVMKLPFSEVGIDTEDAHPRYIACLLRIGDLLDLDNNRFSEVILRTLSKIPLDTLNHKSKHLSIESFRADRKLIEITARCKDYDTANVTQHWFNYLNSEISNQMIKWNNIVPNKDLGYLPTVGDLKVDLFGYDRIDGKNKPRFSVDTDKALGLLQGAGLYDGAYQCIREILQNSVDASLIRMWLEYKDLKDFSSPHNIDFLNLVSNFPIKVKVYQNGVEDIWQNWKIVIEDIGTGISSKDLMFLMNTGSSSKNKERIAIIDSMPDWMRPSGTFGIGFQSVFMLTETVKLETKSFFDEQLQHIELNSPNSIKDGDILIQKKESTHAAKPGTKLSFNYQTLAIPDRYSIKGEHKNASRIAHNYDPFSHDSLDIELGKVFDEIFDFSSKCYFPIELYIEDEKIETTSVNGKKFEFFDSNNSLELNFHFETKKIGYGISTYYKNQITENDLHSWFRGLSVLGFSVNIHQEKASEVLTLNRNKIKPEFHQKLFNQLLDSAFKIIVENFDNIFKTEEERAVGSMFLHFYSDNEIVKKYDISPYNHWEQLKISIGKSSFKMKELLNEVKFLKLIYDNIIDSKIGDLYKLENNTLEITLKGGYPSFEYTKFLLFKAGDYFTSVSKSESKKPNIKEITFSKEKQSSPIPETDMIKVLTSIKKGYVYSARVFIPCLEKYFSLRIKDNVRKSYVYHYVIDNNIYLPFPKMISPFIHEENAEEKSILKVVINEKLIDWVYENRYDNKTTKEQIRNSYDSFIKEFDINEINNQSATPFD